MYYILTLYVIFYGISSITWTHAINFTNESCVALDDCPQVRNLIETKGNHFRTKNLIRLLYCEDEAHKLYIENEDRKVYIKCISKSKIPKYMSKVALLPNDQECGLTGSDVKISGGEPTNLDEFPWIALLRYRKPSGKKSYGCHANLISKKYLLTAAHCIQHNKTDIIGDLYSAVLGEYDIRNKTDCISTEFGNDCAEEAKEYLIESHQMHPEFVSASKMNDIALIRLEGEVSYTDFVKPICLPPNSLILKRNETWWVGGWGETESYKMNDVKQKAPFFYKSKDQCFVNINFTTSQFCAGSSGKAKTCPGDSGGPLMMIRRVDGSIRTYLIGITSSGASCDRDYQVTIFTKTSAYVEWIIDSLRK